MIRQLGLCRVQKLLCHDSYEVMGWEYTQGIRSGENEQLKEKKKRSD